MPKSVNIFEQLNPVTLFQRYPYDIPSAVCEFIDNSIANFERNEHLLTKIYSRPKLKINIIYDVSSHYPENHSLIIEDNALGMTADELGEGLIIQNQSLVKGNLNRYGVGMKSAIMWLGYACEIETSKLGLDQKCFAYMDITDLEKRKNNLTINERFEPIDKHYTVITVSKLNHTLNVKQLRELVKKIQVTYAYKIKQTSKIEIRVCKKEDLKYHSIPDKKEQPEIAEHCEDISPVTYKKRNIWINPENKTEYKWKIQDCVLDQRKVYDFNGFVAIDQKVEDGGVYLYIMERLIEVLPPNLVFGPYNPYRRIFAQLECRGDWIESQTKDKIIWKGDLREKFLNKLKWFLDQNRIFKIAYDLKDADREIDLNKLQRNLQRRLQVLDFDRYGIVVKFSLLPNDQVFSLIKEDERWILTLHITHPLLLQWITSATNKVNELIAIILMGFNSLIIEIQDHSVALVENSVQEMNNFLLQFLKKPKIISKPSLPLHPIGYSDPNLNGNQSLSEKPPTSSSDSETKTSSSTNNDDEIEKKDILIENTNSTQSDNHPNEVEPNETTVVDETNGFKNDPSLPPRDFFQQFIKEDDFDKDRKKEQLNEVAQTNANIINQILFTNNVGARVVNWIIGAQIVHYQIQCEDKVKKIINLENEFKNKLGEKKIYFHLVVPGTNYFGIDVPIPKNLRMSIFWNQVAHQLVLDENNLSFLIGQNVDGKLEQLSLNQSLPHLLIAGATGQGKSVTLLTVLTSLLFINTPQDLKLVLIDIKKVELSCFKNTPHLLKPVVTEVNQVARVLQEMITEIEYRYQLLEEQSLDNITNYNKKVTKDQKLPSIVIVIDEFADLILQQRTQIEEKIVRICQIGRAAGVHIILATQRPSVDVVSSLIKANVQGRISLTVADGYNSKVILDYVGAEKLLGKGDMLCTQPGQEPKRLQGLYIDKQEITELVNFWNNH